MSKQAKPEVVQAVVRGAIGDAVLIAGGVALYVATGVIWWIVGAALLGSTLIVLLVAQAGGFSHGDD